MGWEIVKTRQIFIDGQPYTMMVCRKDGQEKNEKVLVEKGHMFS